MGEWSVWDELVAAEMAALADALAEPAVEVYVLTLADGRVQLIADRRRVRS